MLDIEESRREKEVIETVKVIRRLVREGSIMQRSIKVITGVEHERNHHNLAQKTLE
jgi:hypothetical protein